MISLFHHKPLTVVTAALHQTSPGPMPTPANSYLQRSDSRPGQHVTLFHLLFLQNFPGDSELYLSTSRLHSLNKSYKLYTYSHLYLPPMVRQMASQFLSPYQFPNSIALLPTMYIETSPSTSAIKNL